MTVPITALSKEDEHFVQQSGDLGAMLIWQHQLSTYCGSYGPPGGEEDNWYDASKNNALQLVVEAGEVAKHYSNETKPWKSKYPNLAEVDEEMLDVFHYLLTYFNIRGMSAYEVVVRYRAKQLHNFERVKAKMTVNDNA